MGLSPKDGLYSVVSDSTVAPQIRKAMEQGENFKMVSLIDYTADANVSRAPDYYLYVFNVAPRDFEVRRPPSFPFIKFGRCPKDLQEAATLNINENDLVIVNGQIVARKVMTAPNIVNEKWIDSASGETRVRGIVGERFLMDAINPANLGVDMWKQGEDSWIDSGSDDLSRRGIFFTRNNPPEAFEIAKTKERMEKHYRKLLLEADELWNDEKTRRLVGPEHHSAAEYFHVRAKWHTVAELPTLCENCGEEVKAGAAFHLTAFGVCVRDWQRTVAAGVKSKSDVPEEKRWWKDEPEVAGKGKK